MNSLADLEDRIGAGEPLSRADIDRIAGSSDLPSLGVLGERVRKARHGERVTFVRVCEVDGDLPAAGRGEAGEVRLMGLPSSLEAARLQVRDAARFAAGVPLTGFSLADLLRLAGGDHQALRDAALELKHEGLESVADVPLDEFVDVDAAVAAIRAARHGGLQTWRAMLTRAAFADRLPLLERAAAIQQQTGAFKAFAPLPRHDPRDEPSTGYDDVRTVVLARVIGRDIPSIQVDWRLYGPKLAQVAIAYGADDLDRVSAAADTGEGKRRAPREEIARHIRMAFADPVERDGRYEARR